MSELVETKDLYKWAECKQPAKLMRWLNANHIPYRLSGTGRPITTIDAINASLKSVQLNDEVDF